VKSARREDRFRRRARLNIPMIRTFASEAYVVGRALVVAVAVLTIVLAVKAYHFASHRLLMPSRYPYGCTL
jgi:hypothetical protein